MHETSPIADKSPNAPVVSGSETVPMHEALEPELELNERFPIQLKLSVGATDDPLEYEADEMADRVMRMPETSFIQRKSHCECSEYDDEHIHLKPLASQISPFIQAKSEGGTAVSNSVSDGIKSTMGGGSSMDGGTQSFMESRFGADFSDVKIHNDDHSADLNRSLNAKAFTVSNNVYFNSGQYQPETDAGKYLLAHELTHVVQQSQTTRSETFAQRKGGTVGGFFSNLGRSFVSLFTDELDFSDATLKDYLAVLDTGEIEDDFDSDDKARIVVRRWLQNPAKMPLTPQRKLMLIREMLSGATFDDDENAILALLNKSDDADKGFILGMIDPAELRDKINGEEHTKLETILADVSKRKVQVGPAPVNPTNTKLKDRLALLGDGTAANKGIKVDDFHSYISSQAGWYTEPSLSDPDRQMLWSIATMIYKDDYMNEALGQLMLAQLSAALGTPDMVPIMAYTEGFQPSPPTVRITTAHNTMARVIQLGKAIIELHTFVPDVVMRICINQAHFEKLVDENLIPEFKDYFNKFSPTIENPGEADPLHDMLKDGIAPFVTLKDWVHDLHVFTKKTRKQLVKNITDKTRKRPVLLILMSGMDWNTAFLQAANLEAAVVNAKNLALLIQGATTLKSEVAQLDMVANDYGQIPKGQAKGRLGQVVIAGHGQHDSVEQASTGLNARPFDAKEKNVVYDEEDIQFGKPGKDSEALIDEALKRMDPNDARIVFAGCLVGSHDVAEANVTNIATAAVDINASIQANPNLRDQVNARMKALTIKGRVEAANASTPFGSFVLDSKGKAKLSFGTSDPDIGGTKDEYVKTGMEPEGALRAALETWADPKFGPAWTTAEMKKHVTKFAASKSWYQSLTRTAFKLALPAVGNVDPMVINDLAHRAEVWLDAGWDDMIDVEELTKKVNAAEVPVLYPVMLASEMKTSPHLPVAIQEAWMQVDAAHEATFMAALQATTLKREGLKSLIVDALVTTHLLTLLNTPNPANPSKGQLLLALTIAVNDGNKMPAQVKTLLVNAAGGVKTKKFPAPLKVKDLLEGASEQTVLENIGLFPGSAPPVPGAPVLEDANLDTDNDSTNDTFVAIQPHQATLTGPVIVQSQPNLKSKVVKTLAKGDVVNVVGKANGWTVIDIKGTTAFVLMPL